MNKLDTIKKMIAEYKHILNNVDKYKHIFVGDEIEMVAIIVEALELLEKKEADGESSIE